MSLRFVVPIAASFALAPVALAATDALAYDPSAFLRIAVGDPMPKDFMSLDVREMTLSSRRVQHDGVFYVFEDPSNQGLHATLLLREGRLTGSVYGHGTQIAVIRSVEPGFSSVDTIDGADRAPCACHAGGLPQSDPSQTRRPPAADGGVAGICDTGEFVDVLLVYNDLALLVAGSAQTLEDAIVWAVADANLALSTSETGAQLRIVGLHYLDGYAPADGVCQEVFRMRDGEVPGLLELRDATKADLVSMFTRFDGIKSGCARLLVQNDPSASQDGFNANAYEYLATRVFSHEIGHNFGCGHAPIDPSPVGIFAYSRGHNFTAGGTAYGTALAYTGQIIPRYSNPNVIFDGEPTGIAGERDNARTISDTKLAVSNFRCDDEPSCGFPGNCYDGSPQGYAGCGNPDCCQTVCAQRPECCEVQWDAQCSLLALDLCTECGASTAGSCFEPRATPSCNDAQCCTLACVVDAFCCDQAWDANCAQFASVVCTSQCGAAGAGDCYTPRAAPACADAQCCAVVCATDPLCCTEDWDSSCVATAVTKCAHCGDASLGSCFLPRQAPYCSDRSCCEDVCLGDPTCCDIWWDALCADLALIRCASCGTTTASCFLPHAGTGCNELSCCDAVCAIDLSCCESAWDAGCAQLAAAQCTPQCGDPGAGGCFVPHTTPACRDQGCCSIVCSIDPSCCSSAWDKGCVAIASTGVCSPPPCGDPSLQPCSQASAAPNCQNAQCCQAVCAIDPTCCQTAWDEGCVAATAQACTACSTAGDCNGNGVPDDCDIAGGGVPDANGNGVPDGCECFGDLDGNGTVNAADLAGILNAWGPVSGANAAADLDGNGVVNAADLASVLNSWGPCANAGDEAATAIDIAPGGSASFDTALMTPSPGTPEDGTCPFLAWTPDTRDIWYRVQTGAGGQLGIDLCDSEYDTSMVVYSVSPQGVLTRIACDDDSCQPEGPIFQSRIIGLPVSGTVLIRIGGFGGGFGEGVVRATLGP